MSFNVKRESILTTEIPSGIHLLTINNAKTHKKSNGEIITYDQNPGVIVTYSLGDLKHQEIYWVNGYNYHRLRLLLHQIGVDDSGDIQKKDLLGKKFWGVIVEYKTMRGLEEIKSDKHLVKTQEASEIHSLKDKEFVFYKEDTFNQTGEPAF